MEGRPPPDLEPQNQQEEEEVCVVFCKLGILQGFCVLFVSPFTRNSPCVSCNAIASIIKVDKTTVESQLVTRM